MCWWKIDEDRHIDDAVDGKLDINDGDGNSGEIEDTADGQADNDVSGGRRRRDAQCMSWVGSPG